MIISIFLCCIGIFFIISYNLREKFIIGKILYWISYNLFVPRNKYNHLIWGAIFFLLGIFSFFLNWRKNISVRDGTLELYRKHGFEQWWYKDPIFWIIIVLLVIYGIYKSKKNNEQ